MVVLKVRENHGFGLRFGGRRAPSYAGDFARPQLVDSRDTLTARVRQTWHWQQWSARRYVRSWPTAAGVSVSLNGGFDSRLGKRPQSVAEGQHPSDPIQSLLM